MDLSQYSKIFFCSKERNQATLFSTKTGATLVAPRDLVTDIEKGRIGAAEQATLREQGFLIASEDAEKQEMIHFISDVEGSSARLNLMVVLDLDCNLACRYCFEGTRKGDHYLSPQTADALVDFLKQRDLAGKDEIFLLFYGGEPLLNIDGIVHISEALGPFSEDNGLSFGFSLVTNGTLLTPRTVERLVPLGLRGASVTLDGPREIHDAYRPFRSGSGSFDTILNNIESVCDMIKVSIGGNYSRKEYMKFPRLLDILHDSGLTPEKIPFIRFDPVVSERGEFAPPDFHEGCNTSNEPWLIEASVFLREAILKRGYRTQAVLPSPCMMQFSGNLVVNYDGTFYKCPGLIGRREFCVGSIKDGVADYRRSHGLDTWKNEECLACCYLPLCFGGCRYMALIRDGSMQSPDCRKEYYDHVLERLVCQDIAYPV